MMGHIGRDETIKRAFINPMYACSNMAHAVIAQLSHRAEFQ